MPNTERQLRFNGSLSPRSAALAGAAMAVTGLVMTLHTEPGELIAAYILIAVGVGFAGYRSGTDLDTERGALVHWWGYFVPLIRQEKSIGDIDRIQLDREIRGADKNRRLVYPLRLLDSSGAALELCAPTDYQSARTAAERAARALQRNLHDHSSGRDSIREWDRLDESLIARCQRLGIDPALPDIPRSAGIELGRGPHGEAVIRLKSSGLQLEHGIGITILVGVLAAVIGTLATGSGSLDRGVLVVGGLIALPVLVATIHMLVMAFSSEFVIASGTRLRLPGNGVVSQRQLDFGDIEEILLPASSKDPADPERPPSGLERITQALGQAREVRVRGDWGERGIGGHLSPADQQRLHDALLYIILHGADAAAARMGAGRPTVAARAGTAGRRTVLILLALAVSPLAAWHTATLWPAGLKASVFGRTLPPRPARHYALSGENMVGQREADALVVTVQNIGIRPLGPQRASQYRWPAMEIWVKPGGEWEKLGEQRLAGEAVSFTLDEGATAHHIGAREFRLDGLGQRCRDTRCYARLELHLQLPDGSWGWGAAGPTPILVLP